MNKHIGSTFVDDDIMKVDSDGHVHTIPIDGPEHSESKECWCEPILMDDYTEQGGCKHYLHKEQQ